MLKITYKKKIALFLLLIIGVNIFLPQVCLALTSGPTQPEARGFQPAGVSDMVDLFTGDFKYNIPLLDIDGYPINLNYQSGTGMDDEASWAGLGWNVNVGAINRQVRGIPDDMSGDNVETDHYTKPKVTIGGRVTAKIETKGSGTDLVKLNGSFSVGIFNDNYTGIGADVSANAGINVSGISETPFTAGMGLGITSNTTSGVDLTPTMNLSISEAMTGNMTVQAGLTASLGYNTRSGLKNMTLGSSFDVSKSTGEIAFSANEYHKTEINSDKVQGGTGAGASGSAISFNTQPILPNIQIPYKSRYGSFSLDAGYSFELVFVGGGGTGYKSVREVALPKLINPAYGFLYAERGKNQKNAMMDFIREKENPIIPELPNLAMPVHTPDLFSFTSQMGSGQFRLYRGGSGAFFDNEVSDDDGVTSFGGDLGFGYLFHAGVTLFKQSTKNTTRKWTADNNYLSSGDFQDASLTDPNKQHAYFKLVGEKSAEDATMVSKLHDTQPLEVSITGKTANAQFTNNTLTNLQKQNRATNQTMISYLTAEEANKFALDKSLKNYPINDVSSFQAPANHIPVPQTVISRLDGYRQKHHISEITVTGESGKRMVYGLPVYNVKQTEYSFAIGTKGTDYNILSGTNNIVPLSLINANTPNVSINNIKGIDNYSHSQTQPAYASSFLLTSVLSPDYIDRTGDGITPDDQGTAIKFNYSKLPNLFKWRTPFSGATLNRGMLADKDDDKASIVYGEKELWYTHSIESKTKIAYFITQDRKDALGVTDFTGSTIDNSTPQKCLREIRLYSKADMSKPIKVVKFEYTYELCRGIPNNIDNLNGTLSSDPLSGGKLTLKKVYFEYANSPKGANYPYQFTYQDAVNGTAVNYGDMLTDRWGVYKNFTDNLLPLKNDEYPYTNQDIQGSDATIKAKVDQNAALWHLSSIKLPTGGFINVDYESDDYAYVQNKRAMVMSGLSSLIDASGNDLDQNSPSYLKDAKGFKIQVPNTTVSGDATSWFKVNYLNNSDYIYTKFLIKISNGNSYSGGPDYDYDFVPCYSKIQSVSIDGGFAKVLLQDRTDAGVTANPIIFSAWQCLKDEYPRYAYPGFDTRASDQEASASVSDAVKAIFSALGNLSELTENLYHKAARKNYCSQIQLSKCFVKLIKQDGHKLGGGLRVKRVRITDAWQTMSGSSSSLEASYGQAYTYTTTDNGVTISSGVATYEPSVGNDENALKQPVPYVEKIKGSIDNFFDLEEPFGESFYPAPSVGYSKVTVTDLNKNGDPDPTLRTGYTVSEYYTAKDFPVDVAVMPLSQNENKPFNKFSFLGATSVDEHTMSQGYNIVLNDMHGKEKSQRTFNQAGAEIASTVYYFKTDPRGSDSFRLNNSVQVINPDGTVATKVIGRDIDFFTDFREFESRNSGRSYALGLDMVAAIIVNFPLPHFPTYDNSEYKLFRSACAVKVNQYYGILDKVVKTQNGSSITTQNIAFDGLTGNALVTRTQNEFDKDIFSLDLPAYWAYKGMGPAYQTAGTLLSGFATNTNGEFTTYNDFLKSGDEVADIASGNKYWVIEDQSSNASATSRKMIDIYGQYVPNFTTTGLVKLVRSGYRNMLDATTTSIVSLTNPIQSGRLQITNNADLTSMSVINASVKTYNENWPVGLNGQKPDSTRVLSGNAAIYGQATNYANRGTGGVIFFADPNVPGDIESNSQGLINLQNGLNRSGVWLIPVSDPKNGQPQSISFDVTAPPGNYCVGYEGDGWSDGLIDGNDLAPRSNSVWCVKPVTLTGTTHHVQLSITNNNNGPGGFALELYPRSKAQLQAGDVTIFYSTSSLTSVTQPSYVYRKHINPYTRGFFGNWRETDSRVFQQSRYIVPNTPDKGLNIKSAGYINNFSSYWYYGLNGTGLPGWTSDASGNRARWIKANTVTSYDQFGQQQENKDALGRYSAASFAFNGELPVMVASNAKNRETYNNGFEDSKFSPGTVFYGNKPNEFKQTGTVNDIKQFIVPDISHSGNYSVLLPTGGLELKTNVHNLDLSTNGFLDINDFGEYNTKTDVGVYPSGFEPVPSNPYLFDVWIKDGHATDKSVNLTMTVNGTAVPLICKALVEDWKLLEGNFNPGTSTVFDMVINGSSGNTIYIDDIRMHPFDSHMKSYVYDDKTMRLMAEIDENGFSTFYEYDDEGLLIRVKKETERGVMTLKETRSSYRKGI